MLGLRCCVRALSSCSEQGLLSRCTHWGASPAAEHRLQSTGSVVVADGLSCPEACGIFLEQGSNLYPLHWQADSEPLNHQGSPLINFKFHIYQCVLMNTSASSVTITVSGRNGPWDPAPFFTLLRCLVYPYIPNDWGSQVAQWYRICLLMQDMRVPSLGQKDPLKKETATHNSTLAWIITWTEEPGSSPWSRKESDTTEHARVPND